MCKAWAEQMLESKAEGIAEGKAEGIAEGIAEGEKKTYYRMIINGRITLQESAQELGITEQKLEEDMRSAGYKLPEKVSE